MQVALQALIGDKKMEAKQGSAAGIFLCRQNKGTERWERCHSWDYDTIR